MTLLIDNNIGIKLRITFYGRHIVFQNGRHYKHFIPIYWHVQIIYMFLMIIMIYILI